MIYIVSLAVFVGVAFLLKLETENYIGEKLTWCDTFLFVVAFLILMLIGIKNRDCDWYD